MNPIDSVASNLLVADFTRTISDLLSQNRVVMYWSVIGIVSASVMFILAICWISRRRNRSQARMLFNELCNVHQLTQRQRKLIRRLAGLQKIDEPTTLMMDATRWHLEELEQQSRVSPSDAKELRELQSTLYAPRPKPNTNSNQTTTGTPQPT